MSAQTEECPGSGLGRLQQEGCSRAEEQWPKIISYAFLPGTQGMDIVARSV